MLKSELQSMQVARDRLKERITELEEELAAVKEELHKQKEAAAASAEEVCNLDLVQIRSHCWSLVFKFAMKNVWLYLSRLCYRE